MSGPTTDAPPNPPGYVPPPVPLSYGPPYAPYPYPPLPPKRDNVALIIVIVIVLVVLVPIVLAVVLYVMVSGLTRTPDYYNPNLFLSPAELTSGNATIRIVTGSGAINLSNLRLVLQANHSASAEFGMPPPNGSVAVPTGGYTLRVFWLDDDRDGSLSTGDSFWITGDFGPLPSRTDFSLSLLSTTGQFLAETGWTTD